MKTKRRFPARIAFISDEIAELPLRNVWQKKQTLLVKNEISDLLFAQGAFSNNKFFIPLFNYFCIFAAEQIMRNIRDTESDFMADCSLEVIYALDHELHDQKFEGDLLARVRTLQHEANHTTVKSTLQTGYSYLLNNCNKIIALHNGENPTVARLLSKARLRGISIKTIDPALNRNSFFCLG